MALNKNDTLNYTLDLLAPMTPTPTTAQLQQSTQDKCKFYCNTFSTLDLKHDTQKLKSKCKMCQPVDGHPMCAPHLCDAPDKVPVKSNMGTWPHSWGCQTCHGDIWECHQKCTQRIPHVQTPVKHPHKNESPLTNQNRKEMDCNGHRQGTWPHNDRNTKTT